MSKANYIFLITISTLALIGSYFIVPSKKEIALMYMEDKYFEKAFKEYQELFKNGDFSIAVIIPLSQLYLQFGDVDNAVNIMERFVDLNPNSVEAREQLGVYYQYSQRPDDYKDNLEKLVKLNKSDKLLRELSNIYNAESSYEEQIKILEEIINQKDYVILKQDYLDLAYLYGANEQYDKASAIIERYLLFTKDKLEMDVLELAISLLLDNNKKDKALNYANLFLKDNNYKLKDAMRLATRFEVKNQPHYAISLLNRYENLLDEEDALFEKYISLQISTDEEEQAYERLKNRFTINNLPESLNEAFVELAFSYKDQETLKNILGKLDLKTVNSEILMKFVQMSLELQDKKLAQIVKDELGEKYLSQYPLLMGTLDLAIYGEEKIDEVIQLQKNSNLSQNQKITLVDIYTKLGYDKAAVELLRTIPILQSLASFGAHDVVNLYTRIGQGEIGRQVFAKAQEEQVADKPTLIDLAWMLSSASLGYKDELLNWIDQMEEKLDLQFIKDSFYFANDFKKHSLSLELAQIIYNKEKIEDNRNNLIDAYYNNKLYKKALDLAYNEVTDIYLKLDYIYMASLIGFIKENNLIDAKIYKDKIEIILSRAENTPDMNKSYAYMLLDMGYKKRAEKIFFNFAKNAEADADDVKQIVYLWGENIPEYGKAWLIERASDSEDKNLHHWLEYLNATNNYLQTIKIYLDKNIYSLELVEKYIDALIIAKDSKNLKEVIIAELQKDPTYKYRRKMSIIAMQETLTNLAKKNFKILISEKSDDYDIVKYLAMILYYEGKYDEAGPLFKRFLKYNKGTYLENFAYGEILWNKKYISQSNKYYNRSLDIIDNMQKTPQNVEYTKAVIFMRMNKVKKSINLFEQILVKYPDDQNFKANYANILVSLGNYKRAEQILKIK